jgi:hypothetical protein
LSRAPLIGQPHFLAGTETVVYRTRKSVIASPRLPSGS